MRHSRFCGQSPPPQDDSGTSIASPGNEKTAAKSRVAVLSEVAALAQDRQDREDRQHRRGGGESLGLLLRQRRPPPRSGWRSWRTGGLEEDRRHLSVGGGVVDGAGDP